MRLPEWVLEEIRAIPENYHGQIRLNCNSGGVVNVHWDKVATAPEGWRQREAAGK